MTAMNIHFTIFKKMSFFSLQISCFCHYCGDTELVIDLLYGLVVWLKQLNTNAEKHPFEDLIIISSKSS